MMSALPSLPPGSPAWNEEEEEEWLPLPLAASLSLAALPPSLNPTLEAREAGAKERASECEGTRVQEVAHVYMVLRVYVCGAYERACKSV